MPLLAVHRGSLEPLYGISIITVLKFVLVTHLELATPYNWYFNTLDACLTFNFG